MGLHEQEQREEGNRGIWWKERSGSRGRQGNQRRFDPEMDQRLLNIAGIGISSNSSQHQDGWDNSARPRNGLMGKPEFDNEINGDNERFGDMDMRSSSSKHGEEWRNQNHPVKPQFFNYRTSQLETKERNGTKPNIIQQNQRFDFAAGCAKKRKFADVDSDSEAESRDRCNKKDIDLRLEMNQVESFDIPEDVIGFLIGKKGSTINRLNALCSPAVISVPFSCNSKGFRVIKIEGSKMQIEKSKAVIYKTFREKSMEHLVEPFKSYLKKVEDRCETVSFDRYKCLSDDLVSRDLEIEALKGKLNDSDHNKKDLQNKVSGLIDNNSGLKDMKRELQDQISQMKKDIDTKKETIRILRAENMNYKIEKDFSAAADETWKNVFLKQIEEQKCEIETMAIELKRNKSKLEEKDLLINDLEQTTEMRLKDYLELQSEMQRDFIQCDKCDEKFRSNELLKRHTRFKH